MNYEGKQTWLHILFPMPGSLLPANFAPISHHYLYRDFCHLRWKTFFPQNYARAEIVCYSGAADLHTSEDVPAAPARETCDVAGLVLQAHTALGLAHSWRREIRGHT
jgi:hypothetical protein